jgi:membrane-bound lytic murein transglycosylase D
MLLKMKLPIALILLLTMATVPLRAKPADDDMSDILQSAEEWANENLDSDALQVLQNVDRDRVRKLLEAVSRQFEAPTVADLAEMQPAARAALPLLQSFKETLPYALWLKTRLDYFEEAQRLSEVRKKPEKGKPPVIKPAENPMAGAEREIWIQKLQKRPWPKGSEAYVKLLKPIFAEQKVPPQLIWIAEVESSFDPRARSPVGAAGLFQLMPDTAKRYGLRTGLFDQRIKPEPSAEAAAKYLHYLRNHFKDWRLALAAYNSGEGTVSKLLAKRKTKTFDAISPQLPAETQLFVPKVEATVMRREGVKLAEL